MERSLKIDAGDGVYLPGDLDASEGASAIVVFAHGSGSSRKSPRNREVASVLREDGLFGTLLFDLLTPAEDSDYSNRFDIPLLGRRLEAATRALLAEPGLEHMCVGYFGASTGAAAAIVAAVKLPDVVRAIVSRGGRPDLAGDALPALDTPTLLIVGGLDEQVITMNRSALAQIPAREKRLEIVPGATHLFEEPGTLDQAALLARGWFGRFLAAG
jgi:putative phosphoribosyl transferase